MLDRRCKMQSVNEMVYDRILIVKCGIDQVEVSVGEHC